MKGDSFPAFLAHYGELDMRVTSDWPAFALTAAHVMLARTMEPQMLPSSRGGKHRAD